MTDWPFEDPRNVATFTVRQIMQDGQPILLVCHDEEDGGWQFLPASDVSMSDALLVSLESVVALDPTVAELADLPMGWRAARAHPEAPWVRTPSQGDGAALQTDEADEAE